MIGRMVTSSLRHRPMRTGLSVLAIAMEVTMILMMAGMAEGLLEESQRRTRGIDADILIRPSSSSAVMSLTSADIPSKLTDVLKERYAEIQMAVGMTVISEGDLQTVTGVDWMGFTEMCGGIHYFQGGPPQGPYDAVVDEVYARYRKINAGDSVRLLNQDFRVAAVVESGKMSRIFIPIETMQELMGWQGKFSQIFLKLHDASQTEKVVGQISELLPTYPVYGVEEFLSQVASGVREVSSQFVNMIIAIAVVIGFLVVLLSMYTAILERTREVGILKSLGASQGFIVGVLLRETLAVCAVGIAMGLGITHLVRTAVEANFPLITVLIGREWIVAASLLAVIGSTLGAAYPAARAARQDPISALTYH